MIVFNENPFDDFCIDLCFWAAAYFGKIFFKSYWTSFEMFEAYLIYSSVDLF